MSVVKKVIDDRVLIKPTEKKEMTDGGLINPTGGEKDPNTGTVVVVGQGKYIEGKMYPLTVEVGDEVVYEEYVNRKVMVDGVEYEVVKESEIMLVLN